MPTTVQLTGRRAPVRAGALVRRAMRRALLAEGAAFTEERGLLDSVFYVDVPAGYVLSLTFPATS